MEGAAAFLLLLTHPGRDTDTSTRLKRPDVGDNFVRTVLRRSCIMPTVETDAIPHARLPAIDERKFHVDGC